jgi:hypothetical protein
VRVRVERDGRALDRDHVASRHLELTGMLDTWVC